MRIRTIIVSLVAVVALGVGGMLAMRAASAYAAAEGGGFAHSVAGVMKNGLKAFGDHGGVRIRTASSSADEADGGDNSVPAVALKRALKLAMPSHNAIRIEHLGMLPEGFDDEPGVLVAGVQTDGPAAAAGLSRGDIIVGVEGEVVETLDDLHSALENRQGGETIALDVEHGDERLSLQVTLDDLDGSAWLGIAPCGGGMHGMPGISPFIAELHGAGARIMGLESGGPAETAGVLEGEVITAVDGVEVDPMNDLGDVLSGYAPGDTVALTLAPAGMPSTITLDSLGGDDDEAGGSEDDADSGIIVESPETRDVQVTLGEHPDDPERAFLGVQYGMSIGGGHDGDFDFNFDFSLDSESLGLPEGFDLEHLEKLEGLHGEGRGHGGPFMFKWFGGPKGHDGMESFSMEGAIVSDLDADGPAAAAGLAGGDVITTIDGEPVDSPEALAELVSARSPGETVTLGVTNVRSEEDESAEPREIEVVLGEHPDEAGSGYLGVTVGGFMSIERLVGPDGEDGASFHFAPHEEHGGIFKFFHGRRDNAPMPVPAMPVDGGTL